jgi:hypothetical protein
MNWWQRSMPGISLESYSGGYHHANSDGLVVTSSTGLSDYQYMAVEETGNKYAIEPATNMWNQPVYNGV